MIDWENSVVTPQPLLESLSNEKFVHLVEVGPLSVPQIPCHTQAVKRAIKEVTRVSTKVFRRAARHGMIVATSSREIQKTAQTAGRQKHFLPDDS